MTGAEFYNELKTWQTSVAAILGFAGLITGALWNFHLNRIRDKYVRDEESRSVLAALYGEIILLREDVARAANTIAYRHWNEQKNYRPDPPIDDDLLQSTRLSEPVMFSALASKLGLLQSDMVVDISRFYYNYKQVTFYLPLLVRRPDNKVQYTASYVLEPARDAVRNIEPTLKLMQECLKPIGGFRSVLVSDVDDIIELEREFFDE